MNISEKVAYIKGLAEGLNCDDKIVNAILDVLGDMADAIGGIKEDQEYLENYIEEIDEDLGALEEDFYEIDEDDCDCCDCCDDDDDDDCDCCDCDDEEVVEVSCPACNNPIYLDLETEPDHVVCPNCGAEFTCVCDCCDEDDEECDCGCHHEE